MTDDEIRAAVQADPRLQRLAAAGNTWAIAAALAASAGRAQVGDVLTTRGAAARYPVVDGLAGPLAFEAAMIALEDYAAANTASAVQLDRLRARSIARMLDVFPTMGLDFGDGALRETLDTLTPDALSADQVAAFKGLAGRVPARVTARQVAAAIGQVLPDVSTEPAEWTSP